MRPNNNDSRGLDPESIFSQAENATEEDEGQVRRTITMVSLPISHMRLHHLSSVIFTPFCCMALPCFLIHLTVHLEKYRDGFTVDDGPYRRLDDPNNAEFLRALAMGRPPAELAGDGDVVVGLLDKRTEEFVEAFQSFSGEGNSLGGTATASADGAFDPVSLPETPPPLDDHKPVTSIQVRLPNGTRRVIRINLAMTVGDLAAFLRSDAGSDPFRLVAGFPPKPLTDADATIEGAGLKGAQVTLQSS